MQANYQLVCFASIPLQPGIPDGLEVLKVGALGTCLLPAHVVKNVESGAGITGSIAISVAIGIFASRCGGGTSGRGYGCCLLILEWVQDLLLRLGKDVFEGFQGRLLLGMLAGKMICEHVDGLKVRTANGT